MDKPSYFAVIPASVRYDKRLKPIERLLFGEITCLTNKDGYCYASSSYFAELYDTQRETISRYISNLAKYGYIKIEIDNGCQRKIFLDGGVTKVSHGVTELSHGVTESSQGCDRTITGGCDQTITQNNTSNNNNFNKLEKEKINKKEKAVKHKYGRYQNVLLSDDELEELKKEFPVDWQERIERVSEYCASKGRAYKNYLATIRAWARKDGDAKPPKKESLEEMGARINAEVEKRRAEGKSKTMEQIKAEVEEKMRREGKLNGTGNTT